MGKYSITTLTTDMRVCVCVCAQLCPTLQPHGLKPARLLCPWDYPGKNTGVGCHALLQALPDPGIGPMSPLSPALAGGFFCWDTWGSTLTIDISYLEKKVLHSSLHIL